MWVVVLAAALLCSGLAGAVMQSDAAQPGSTAQLERQKLRREIRQIELDNRNSSGLRGFLATFAAPLTALAAAAGIVVTLSGNRREQTRQREQREAESRRHLDERFAQILVDLGSASEAVQAGAAAALLTFLTDENKQFRRQVRLASLANLKVKHTPVVRNLLLKAFEDSMRTGEAFEPAELDLSAAHLERARLNELDLSGADLRGTDLTGANLFDSKLREARGRKVILKGAKISGEGSSLFNARLPEASAAKARFNGAELVNAHLEHSDLRGAQFRGARMQAAHLENAKLQEARFEGANVADTHFVGASFDEQALRGLLRAENWERAHFSPQTERQLRAAESGSGSARKKRPDEGPTPNEEPHAQG